MLQIFKDNLLREHSISTKHASYASDMSLVEKEETKHTKKNYLKLLFQSNQQW